MEKKKKDITKNLPAEVIPNELEDKIFQSWTLTKIRYDFSLIEKNIFIKIVELSQKFINKDFLGRDCTLDVESTLFGEVPTIEFPIRDVAAGNNYIQVRNSLDKLMNSAFGIPTDEDWDYHTVNLFEEAKSGKKKGVMRVTLTTKFWKALNQVKVYKILNTHVATKFKSVYAERFYELLIGNKQHVVFSVDHLKSMFCLEVKYKNNNDFIKRVVDPSAKEMKEMDVCPIYFEYTPITGARRKIEKLDFLVIEKKEHMDKDDARKNLEKEVESVTLVERVLETVKRCFPRLVMREDVELKLKLAQLTFGVNELCDTIENLKMKIEGLKSEGKVKSGVSAYFLGTLEKMVEQKRTEMVESHIDKAPKKVQNAVEVEEWEDGQYKYLTDKKVRHSAKLVNLSVEEWTHKYNFEKVDEYTWRFKKEK